MYAEGHANSGVYSELLARGMVRGMEHSTHDKGRGGQRGGTRYGVEVDPVATTRPLARVK